MFVGVFFFSFFPPPSHTFFLLFATRLGDEAGRRVLEVGLYEPWAGAQGATPYHTCVHSKKKKKKRFGGLVLWRPTTAWMTVQPWFLASGFGGLAARTARRQRPLLEPRAGFVGPYEPRGTCLSTSHSTTVRKVPTEVRWPGHFHWLQGLLQVIQASRRGPAGLHPLHCCAGILGTSPVGPSPPSLPFSLLGVGISMRYKLRYVSTLTYLACTGPEKTERG